MNLSSAISNYLSIRSRVADLELRKKRYDKLLNISKQSIKANPHWTFEDINKSEGERKLIQIASQSDTVTVKDLPLLTESLKPQVDNLLKTLGKIDIAKKAYGDLNWFTDCFWNSWFGNGERTKLYHAKLVKYQVLLRKAKHKFKQLQLDCMGIFEEVSDRLNEDNHSHPEHYEHTTSFRLLDTLDLLVTVMPLGPFRYFSNMVQSWIKRKISFQQRQSKFLEIRRCSLNDETLAAFSESAKLNNQAYQSVQAGEEEFEVFKEVELERLFCKVLHNKKNNGEANFKLSRGDGYNGKMQCKNHEIDKQHAIDALHKVDYLCDHHNYTPAFYEKVMLLQDSTSALTMCSAVYQAYKNNHENPNKRIFLLCRASGVDCSKNYRSHPPLSYLPAQAALGREILTYEQATLDELRLNGELSEHVKAKLGLFIETLEDWPCNEINYEFTAFPNEQDMEAEIKKWKCNYTPINFRVCYAKDSFRWYYWVRDSANQFSDGELENEELLTKLDIFLSTRGDSNFADKQKQEQLFNLILPAFKEIRVRTKKYKNGHIALSSALKKSSISANLIWEGLLKVQEGVLKHCKDTVKQMRNGAIPVSINNSEFERSVVELAAMSEKAIPNSPEDVSKSMAQAAENAELIKQTKTLIKTAESTREGKYVAPMPNGDVRVSPKKEKASSPRTRHFEQSKRNPTILKEVEKMPRKRLNFEEEVSPETNSKENRVPQNTPGPDVKLVGST